MDLQDGRAPARVVIADCDPGRRVSLREIVLRFDPGAVIDEATSGQALCDILLRHRPTLASCRSGGHVVWWTVSADDETDALRLLPPYVAERTTISRVNEVHIP